MTTRSGIGIDIHPLVEGRRLVLGGVTIPYDRGLAGHSDGDVLIHAVIDALLGGAGLGDIGTHFPSDDDRYLNVDSSELLGQTVELVEHHQWRARYVDATILAERPVLKPFIGQIKEALASSLGLDRQSVNIKATTADGLGFVGRSEGIASLVIATLDQMP